MAKSRGENIEDGPCHVLSQDFGTLMHPIIEAQLHALDPALPRAFRPFLRREIHV
jgi:hypothetical protein